MEKHATDYYYLTVMGSERSLIVETGHLAGKMEDFMRVMRKLPSRPEDEYQLEVYRNDHSFALHHVLVASIYALDGETVSEMAKRLDIGVITLSPDVRRIFTEKEAKNLFEWLSGKAKLLALIGETVPG